MHPPPQWRRTLPSTTAGAGNRTLIAEAETDPYDPPDPATTMRGDTEGRYKRHLQTLTAADPLKMKAGNRDRCINTGSPVSLEVNAT